MSPFETYLIFKASSIKTVIGLIAIIPFAAFIFYMVRACIHFDNNTTSRGKWETMDKTGTEPPKNKFVAWWKNLTATNYQRQHNTLKRWAWFYLLLGFSFLLAAKAFPSRNTLIAMQIVPTITSDAAIGTISTESKDMYKLFRDWLKQEINGFNKPNPNDKKSDKKEETNSSNNEVASMVKELVKEELKRQVTEIKNNTK